ncbi:MAG: DUF2341 domain-containing protein [Chitinivibrionales bacterium]|nr:DUF2341 domain-containing protein [Chitinivibrionales bacterium]
MWPFLQRTLFYLPVLILMLSVSCFEPENPYIRQELAQVKVSGLSELDGDTVEIFQTLELEGTVLLAAFIDSFKMAADDNRFESESRVRRGGDSTDFTVSFFDTGHQQITLTTYLTDGSKVSQSATLYCTSPLDQKDITRRYGETAQLATPGVTDKVQYVWEFPHNREFIQDTNEAVVLFDKSYQSGIGRLYVRAGGHQSPARLFNLSIADLTPPVITALNDTVSSRFIITNSTPLAFRVRIRDEFSSVTTYLANNRPFDDAVVSGSGAIEAVKNYEAADFAADNILIVAVYAEDAHYNSISDSFTIFYGTAPVSTAAPALARISPSHDTVNSEIDSVLVRGVATGLDTAENYSVFIDKKAPRGKQAYAGPLSISSQKPYWEHVIKADDSLTVYYLSLYDNVSASDPALETDTIWYFYTKPSLDSGNPEIVYVKSSAVLLDGKPYFTRSLILPIEVLAVDNHGSISTVRINGRAAQDIGAHRYVDTLQLQHIAEGNEIMVTARNAAGKSITKSVIVYHNNLPVFTHVPQFSSIAADSNHLDSLKYADADGDSVILSAVAFYTGDTTEITVGPNGLFTLTPRRAEINKQIAVRFTMNDQLQLRDTTVYFAVHKADTSGTGTGALGASLVNASSSCNEANDACEISVALSRPATAAVSVDFVVDYARSTADSNDIQLPTPTRLDFDIGDSVKTFVIPIVNDSLYERDEVLTIVMVDKLFKVNITAPFEHTCTIHDNEQTKSPFAQWSHFMPVYLNTTRTGAYQTSELTRFPVLVRLNKDNFDFDAARQDGGDLRFSTFSSVAIPFEIERWDYDNRRADIWVLVNRILPDNDAQHILMFWGRSAAEDSSDGSKVFHPLFSSYGGVWHLNETPEDRDSGAHLDATGIGRNATPAHFQDGGNGTTDTAGLIGGADFFGGDSDVVAIPDFYYGDEFTISFWFRAKKPPAQSGYQYMFSHADYNVNQSLNIYYSASNGIIRTGIIDENDPLPSTVGLDAYVADIFDNKWHLYAITVKEGEGASIFIDGILRAQNAERGGDFFDPRYPVILGGRSDFDKDRFYEGFLDEVRISRTARSEAWVRLCFENQRIGQSFVTVDFRNAR